MKQSAHVLHVRTSGKGLVDITREVGEWVARQTMRTGLLTVFCRHTSASLLIQENAAPEVRRDLIAYFDRIAPEGAGLYEHDDEGPDDMPAHLKSGVFGTSQTIPVGGGNLLLGTWQGVYLGEHRDAGGSRTVVVTLWGEE